MGRLTLPYKERYHSKGLFARKKSLLIVQKSNPLKPPLILSMLSLYGPLVP